jgi:ADP-ribose pyrophosphatase YjhB (NUDIX family)
MLKSCKKKIINLENVLEEVYGEYNVRETARAIILDSQNKIAMIHVSKNNYYQLVGGGIERGESVGGGLKRECLEEAGVEIELLDKLCDVKEVGYFAKQIQNSYCYVARVVGEKGETKFTQDESGLYGLKSV